MFNMLPFLMNSMMGGVFNTNNNINNNVNNNINNNFNKDITNNNNGFTSSYTYSSFTNGNNMFGVIGGTFTSVFNEVFTSLITNEDLMNSIVGTVLNSEAMGSLIDSIEEELNLDFMDYGDRYLIEGKLVGIDKKDIDIDYESDHITIKIKRGGDFDSNNPLNTLFQEVSSLEKSFYVPNVEANKIQAVYNANVLRVYLKKAPPIERGTTVIDVENFIDTDDSVEVENYIEAEVHRYVEEETSKYEERYQYGSADNYIKENGYIETE